MFFSFLRCSSRGNGRRQRDISPSDVVSSSEPILEEIDPRVGRKMLLFHAEPVLSSGEDVELYRFASFVPSFIESCCRERCDEDVAVGNRKKERRGIVWHRCCCGIAWVDTSRK